MAHIQLDQYYNKLKHGNLIEVPVDSQVKQKLYLNYKHKNKDIQEEIKQKKKLISNISTNKLLALEESVKDLKKIY